MGVRSKGRLPHGWGQGQSQSSSQADGSCNIVLKRGRGNVGLGRRKRKWQHFKTLQESPAPYAIFPLQRPPAPLNPLLFILLNSYKAHFSCCVCISHVGVSASSGIILDGMVSACPLGPGRHQGVDRWACAVQGGVQ